MKKRRKSDSATLTAFDEAGEIVETCEMSIHDYYDELHPMMDDPEYISKHGIRRLTGLLIGERGKVSQEFESLYDKDGIIYHSKIVHADGTVTEHDL